MRKQKRLLDSGTRFDVAFERLQQKRKKRNSSLVMPAADKAAAPRGERGAAATDPRGK
jgi:hypothetical protein